MATKRTIPLFLLTGREELTLLRREPDTYVMGRPVKGAVVEVAIEANIQPLGYRDTMMLPESDRTKEWVKVYSASAIRALLEVEDGWAADEFEWENKKFKVMKSHRYNMGVLDHYVAHATRITEV